MSITFKYTIVSVDENARCMEVVYEADGHETMHIGVRLPFENENLEDVIRVFAPIPLWIEKATPVVVPAVGSSAVIEPPPIEIPDDGEEVIATSDGEAQTP